MTEAELRHVILSTFLELITPPPRRALVVFTGALLGFEDAIESLRRLAAAGVQLDYVQTPSAERLLDQDLIAGLGMRNVSRRMVEQHDLLIAPTLTANIAAKVATGVADCLASNLFADFLLNNRLIVASRTAICPDGAEKRSWFPNMPDAYADLLRHNLAALASFGVRLCDARTLCRTSLAAWQRREQARHARLLTALGTSPEGFRHAFGDPAPTDAAVRSASPGPTAPAIPTLGAGITCSLNLISQQVVQQLPAGVELKVSAGALVTAAARDAAAARTIRISREV